MNSEAKIETKKRLELVEDFSKEIKDNVLGIILVGSTAYAPNEGVRKDSDIDIIVVYEDIKKCAADYFDEDEYLQQGTYDGYLVKRHENLGHKIDLKSKNSADINLSIHNINFSALQKISQGNCGTLAYYRQSQKGTTYYSKDFDGNKEPFKPECISVLGQIGERRIDSIAFQSSKGNYVIGNDMDKLLSGAQIIYDKTGQIKNVLENLWLNVTKKLIEHRRKNNQTINPYNEDIAPLLFRYDRFSDEVKQNIKQKTMDFIIKNIELEKENKSVRSLGKDENIEDGISTNAVDLENLEIKFEGKAPVRRYDERTGCFEYKDEQLRDKARQRKEQSSCDDILQQRLRGLKKHLGCAGLGEHIGKTGNSSTGEVSEQDKTSLRYKHNIQRLIS
ncbi:MAG: nucleotidyltransferase domain-containing protein [Alphaproteobacteria bacterium]|nr:nucleotidyltransferase domain-containing protein [Alphaproteobacteria bacterium]